MPEISRFYGIIIYMFHREHNPPHFHAVYGEYEILIDIEALSVLAGKFPPRALGLVMEWAALHQEELKKAWQKAMNLLPLDKVEPLK